MKKTLLIIAAAALITLPIWSIGTAQDNASNSWLGVYTQTVDKDLKEAFRLDTDHGVVVNQVIPDSPADQAGLKRGDIILTFDGVKMSGSDQLAELVAKHNPGDAVKMEILRKGETIALAATIGERDDNNYLQALPRAGSSPRVFSKSFSFDKSSFSDSYIGVNLESLGSQLGKYFGINDGKGALVTEVVGGSPAEKAGLKAGDVITAIDGREISGPSDVQQTVGDKTRGDKLSLTILRDRSQMDLAVEIAERPDYMSAMPNIPAPDFDNSFFFSPRMKGLLRGNIDQDNQDMETMQQSIDQLKTQIRELQEQLKDMQSKTGR